MTELPYGCGLSFCGEKEILCPNCVLIKEGWAARIQYEKDLVGDGVDNSIVRARMQGFKEGYDSALNNLLCPECNQNRASEGKFMCMPCGHKVSYNEGFLAKEKENEKFGKTNKELTPEQIKKIKDINSVLEPEKWDYPKHMFDSFILGFNLGKQEGSFDVANKIQERILIEQTVFADNSIESFAVRQVLSKLFQFSKDILVENKKEETSCKFCDAGIPAITEHGSWVGADKEGFSSSSTVTNHEPLLPPSVNSTPTEKERCPCCNKWMHKLKSGQWTHLFSLALQEAEEKANETPTDEHKREWKEYFKAESERLETHCEGCKCGEKAEKDNEIKKTESAVLYLNPSESFSPLTNEDFVSVEEALMKPFHSEVTSKRKVLCAVQGLKQKIKERIDLLNTSIMDFKYDKELVKSLMMQRQKLRECLEDVDYFFPIAKKGEE